MAHIHIEEFRRRLNLAAAAQRAALPPQPPRHDRSEWGFTRRPWVHALDLRAKSYTVGLPPPLLARLREDSTFSAAIAAGLPALDLEKLIALPELPAEIYGQIKVQSLSYDPSAPDIETLALYEPTGIHRNTQVIASRANITGPFDLTWQSTPIPAPCIIQSVTLQTDAGGTQDQIIASVSGLGVVANIVNEVSNSVTLGGGKGLNIWVLSGNVQGTLQAIAAAGGAQIVPGMTLNINVELLRRKP